MTKRYRLTLALIVLIAVYLGWIYYSRWNDNQALLDRVEEQKALQDQPLPDIYGDGNVTILMFYATPPVIHQGNTAQICFGVVSTEKVRIEPFIEDIWPSPSLCVDVAPNEDTVYRLIAEDAEGNIATAETSVSIVP